MLNRIILIVAALPLLIHPALSAPQSQTATAAPGASSLPAKQTMSVASEGEAASKLHQTRTDNKKLTIFFMIGMVINVLFIILFLVWAVRQWRKHKSPPPQESGYPDH